MVSSAGTDVVPLYTAIFMKDGLMVSSTSRAFNLELAVTAEMTMVETSEAQAFVLDE